MYIQILIINNICVYLKTRRDKYPSTRFSLFLQPTARLQRVRCVYIIRIYKCIILYTPSRLLVFNHLLIFLHVYTYMYM